MKLIKVLTISLLLTSTVLSSELIDGAKNQGSSRHPMLPFVVTPQECPHSEQILENAPMALMIQNRRIDIAHGFLDSTDHNRISRPNASCIELINNPEPHDFPRHLMVHYVMTQRESRELQAVLEHGSLRSVRMSIGVAQGLLSSGIAHSLIVPSSENISDYAIRSYANAEYTEPLKWLLSNACPIKPKNNGGNIAFGSAARNNDLALMDWLFSDACSMKPNQEGVDSALHTATTNNQLPVVKWFFTDACPIKPGQARVDIEFETAAKKDHFPCMEWFLSEDCPLKPHRDVVNKAFQTAAGNNQLLLVKWFFSDACSAAPTQDHVNEAFQTASKNNRLAVVGWFLSEDCPLKPHQDAVNSAFFTAAIYNSIPCMECLLSGDRAIRPEIGTLMRAYRHEDEIIVRGNAIAVQARQHLILNHLPQQVSQILLAEQAQGGVRGRGRGVAFEIEIHNYAGQVFREAMAHISAHLPDTPLPSSQEIQQLLLQKGHDLFNSEDQSKVSEAILTALSPGYMETLARVLHFVQTHHADNIDLWIHTFIDESITAYNSLNTLSCSKGVEERIVTGLRTLGDESLNRICAPAEGSLLLAKKFSLFNLDDESMKAARIQDLKALGVTADTSDDELVLGIRKMVNHKFEGDVLTEDYTRVVEEIVSNLIEQMGSDRTLFHT